jgi:hypothetical protein
MAEPQSVLERSSQATDKGERSVLEFTPMPVKPNTVSLGDAARELRKEHAKTKKATRFFEN